MKTKRKLILQFSLLFAALLIVVMTAIYLLVSKDIQASFYKRLEDRAYTIGHTYLASDNFTTEEYQEVLKKYPRTLPTERIRVYDMQYKPIFIKEDGYLYERAVIDQIIQKGLVQFERDRVPAVGILYKDNSGDFVIIASAANIYGMQSLQELLYAMVISFVLAIAITIILGNVFAGWILSPINSIINHMRFVEASKLNERLPLRSVKNDEIETLKETINQVFERLQQTFETQQSFISNASHELKTPIAVIMGNAEITLRKKRSILEYREVLQDIVLNCNRIDDLIHNLLDLAQVDFQMLKTQDFLFEDFYWESIHDILHTKPQIQAALDIDAPQGLGNIYVNGNPNLLKIALSNLIHNAGKFSNYEEINIRLILQDNAVLIEVVDQGIGIQKQDIHKVLTPFYRAKNALSQEGYGLGLSMSQKIINLHKGQLRIESELNKGTIVTVRLPYIKKEKNT
ncbi:ATP-binding protein [Sphingobacterium sp. Mn56C]|uniref:HAMP domain-containing sensor histidine kinase n=1 Tax=Sphingobacterium sp. Mn56C TaxID=3395261 RepID=UPI003BDE12A1